MRSPTAGRPSSGGDPTAAMLGRLTLNPVPHIDPMGLFVFVLTSLTGPFVFGWAKPVPINPGISGTS